MGYLNWRCQQNTWLESEELYFPKRTRLLSLMQEKNIGWTMVMSILTVASISFLTLMPRKKMNFIIRTCYMYTVLWVPWEADSGWRTAYNSFIGEYSGISTCERTRVVGLDRGISWVVMLLQPKWSFICFYREFWSWLISDVSSCGKNRVTNHSTLSRTEWSPRMQDFQF